jgi:hypothetical protein
MCLHLQTQIPLVLDILALIVFLAAVILHVLIALVNVTFALTLILLKVPVLAVLLLYGMAAMAEILKPILALILGITRFHVLGIFLLLLQSQQHAT